MPHPFIKWAGGKRQLIPQLDRYLPKSFNTYIEPFTGGGALFFYLLPRSAVLIDSNPELINCYNVIKNSVEELINSLNKLKDKNEKSQYYKIRDMDRDPDAFNKLNAIERASRTLYLNKTCYNGLYRVNQSNLFNTPFGRYKNPVICDEDNLRAVNVALQNAKIELGDFSLCLKYAQKGDFIYFDSPYDPLNATANFTSYTQTNFNQEEQKRLSQTFKELDKKGCKLLLSNSYTDFILGLYDGFQKIEILATRAINSDASKRGKIKEVLVTNFKS